MRWKRWPTRCRPRPNCSTTTGRVALPRCALLHPPQSEFLRMHALCNTYMYGIYKFFSHPCLHVPLHWKITPFAVLFLFLNSFHCFHQYLLILTSSFIYLLSRPLCSFFFFNVSPPSYSKCFCDSKSSPIWTPKKKQNGHMVYKHRSR